MTEPAPAAGPAGPPPEEAGARRRRQQVVARRLIAAILLLAAGLLLSRRQERPPEPPPVRPDERIFFSDVAGWYQRTPQEVAVRSPYALSLDALPGGLPLSLGPWQGQDRPHDPAIDVWLSRPEVSIERTYRRADGELVWLTAFGSRGDKSFRLFEHTPQTCYPLSGWAIQDHRVTHLPLGPRPLAANYGLARHTDGRRLVVLYLYLWDSPSRDAARGVVSLRLAAPVSRSPESTLAMLGGDFLGRLFSGTLSWNRF